MEKIILVNYVAVGNMSMNEVHEYLEDFERKIVPKDEGIFNYIVPIKGYDSRVECLNPKLVSEDDYKQAKELLDRNQKIVDELVESYKK